MWPCRLLVVDELTAAWVDGSEQEEQDEDSQAELSVQQADTCLNIELCQRALQT